MLQDLEEPQQENVGEVRTLSLLRGGTSQPETVGTRRALRDQPHTTPRPLLGTLDQGR